MTQYYENIQTVRRAYDVLGYLYNTNRISTDIMLSRHCSDLSRLNALYNLNKKLAVDKDTLDSYGFHYTRNGIFIKNCCGVRLCVKSLGYNDSIDRYKPFIQIKKWFTWKTIKSFQPVSNAEMLEESFRQFGFYIEQKEMIWQQ